MSGHRLRLQQTPTGPIDAAELQPVRLAALSPTHVAQLPLLCGGRLRRVGDIFDIEPLTVGETASETPRLEIEAAAAMHRLGWGLTEGHLHIIGTAGTLLGGMMSGGRITVSGNAGAMVGAGLCGGRIEIDGSVGERLGGPVPGSWRGMTGGEIVVHESAGPYAGLRQRGGLIAVAGCVERYAGFRMLAGTLIVSGEIGPGGGTQMQRGTIISLQTPASESFALSPPASFGIDGPTQPIIWRLLARRLTEFDFPLPPHALELTFTSYSGDLLTGGRGELLVATIPPQ